jgi:hypothetical protein
MEADLTTTDVNPPRRMTARTGDAMLAADAPSRVCWSGGAEGVQPRHMAWLEDIRRAGMRHGPVVCLKHCTGAGACRIRNRYANTPRPACWREWAGMDKQGPAPKFRRGRFLNAPPFAQLAVKFCHE